MPLISENYSIIKSIFCQLFIDKCEVYSAPRIYPSLPESTPIFNNYMRPSRNFPLTPRIYPHFKNHNYATLPESTPSSQNILRPFQPIYMCDPPRIYPSFPEYTHLFNKCICATLPESNPTLPQYTPLFNYCVPPSQNSPLPPRIYPLFNNYNIMRPSQNPPLPPRIYPPFKPIYMCDPPRIYPSLPSKIPPPPFQQLYATPPESTPPSQNIPPFSAIVYVRPSQNLLFSPRIYPPPFSTTICDPPRIYAKTNLRRLLNPNICFLGRTIKFFIAQCSAIIK